MPLAWFAERPPRASRRTRRRRRCCCSAPTASAATSSAGCCSARALSLGLALAAALGAMLLGALLGGARRLRRRRARRSADARDRLRDGAAGDVRRAGAALGAAAGAAAAHGVRAARRHLRGRRRAVRRARRPRDRPLRAPARLRVGRAVARRERRARCSCRHLLPATRGFLAVQITLLVPAFIVAEATLSYVGLGFPDPVASWGTMLHDASTNIRVFADFPWLLSPAAAMFLVVLGLNLVLQEPQSLRPGTTRRSSTMNAHEPRRRLRSDSHAVRRPRSRRHRAPEGGARSMAGARRSTGFVVLGSNGEAALLDDVESDQAIVAARDAVPRDRPFIVGTGRESTQATITRDRSARRSSAPTPCWCARPASSRRR